MKIEHNRRCFIADLDFGEDREALEAFFVEWMKLIRPWCRPGWWSTEIHGEEWPEHEMPYTVAFGSFRDLVNHLRPVSVVQSPNQKAIK